MPTSPFPGMDPYLEAPDIWPDVHERLAGEISIALNGELPKPYYAQLEKRPEIGIISGPAFRRIVPDVAVLRPPAVPPGGRSVTAAVGLLERPRTEASPSVELEIETESYSHPFVEVRDASRGHKLITLIEIVSPSNKTPGPDRDAYIAKQDEILQTDASLIEIDLLRRGQRILPIKMLATLIGQIGSPRTDYLILTQRAWLRGGWPAKVKFQAFAISIRQSLPCISVPLREGEAEVPLDLQFIFQKVYAGGPYARGAVDYGGTPDPALDPADVDWATQLLTAR